MKDWANPSKGGDAKLQGLHRMVSQPAALTGTTGSEQVAFVLPVFCCKGPAGLQNSCKEGRAEGPAGGRL